MALLPGDLNCSRPTTIERYSHSAVNAWILPLDASVIGSLFATSYRLTNASGFCRVLEKYYKSVSHNILPVAEGKETIREGAVHHGKQAIVAALMKLPSTRHDPTSLLADVSFVRVSCVRGCAPVDNVTFAANFLSVHLERTVH